MGSLLLPAPAFPAFAAPCSPLAASRSPATRDLHLALWLQLVGAVDDDLLAGLETAAGHDVRPFAQRDRDRADVDALVGMDDVDVRPLRAVLHGRCGDGQGV